MKHIIDFLETHVNGRNLHTKELTYELENGALQGVYSDQISFSNLKYSQIRWYKADKVGLAEIYSYQAVMQGGGMNSGCHLQSRLLYYVPWLNRIAYFYPS